MALSLGKGPPGVRIITSTLGIVAALVMCAVSAAMNWLFLSSLGKTPLEGQVLGAASAAADSLKALLPFLIAWSWQARRYMAAILGSLAFVFFAAFSLLSAIGFAADNRGFLVGKRDEMAGAYERVQRDLHLRESQRAALAQSRPPAVVELEIERLRQNRRWRATKACTNATEAESRDYCAGYFALRTELAAGQEEARLSSLVAALGVEAEHLRKQGSGQDSDPQVTLLARLSGLSAEPVRLALILAVAVLVEIGASLGLFLASGHSAPVRKAAPESDAVVGSIEDFCLAGLSPAAKSAALAAELLQDGYRAWCRREGRTPLPCEGFTSGFAELADAVGIPRSPGGWRGIALKHDNAALDMVS